MMATSRVGLYQILCPFVIENLPTAIYAGARMSGHVEYKINTI